MVARGATTWSRSDSRSVCELLAGGYGLCWSGLGHPERSQSHQLAVFGLDRRVALVAGRPVALGSWNRRTPREPPQRGIAQP